MSEQTPDPDDTRFTTRGDEDTVVVTRRPPDTPQPSAFDLTAPPDPDTAAPPDDPDAIVPATAARARATPAVTDPDRPAPPRPRLPALDALLDGPPVGGLEPLRRTVVDQALGRADPDPLDRFLAADDVGMGLLRWFGGALFHAVRAGGAAAIRSALDRDIAALDGLLSDQVDAILHHPRVQSLEAAWRGLRYLAEQADGREQVVLRLLPCRWTEIARDLERAIEFDQSALFDKIYNQEFGMPGGKPFGLLLILHAVQHRPTRDHPHDDVSVLKALSQVAAAAFAPVILAARPALLGLEDYSDLAQPIDIARPFGGADYARWRAFQRTEDSRFVGVCLPRILMREPWRDDGTRADGFRYAEGRRGLRARDHLWGHPGFAFAAVLIRAFDSYGWFADIRGSRRDEIAGGLVTGLPTPAFRTDAPGIALRPSLEVSIADRQENVLTDLGLIPLLPARFTRYSVFYGNASTRAVDPMETLVATMNHRLSSMLQYIFCVSRFSHFIKVIGRDRVGSFTTPEDCERFLQDWLMGYCLGNDDASLDQKARYPLREASVRVREVPGKPGAFACVTHLKPHFQLDQVVTSFRLTTELAPPDRR
ncbi:type VI secretion system contractile sheath large subunit [Roseospira visakhapatnamensis]|uniref:Type VI secretion system protein ImpD n=1 Tax=Roseospira visakhapatnamensis TaxID=390880 RepID=A0A7W6WB76_9PROT|nr:type VI secretion system contractile sheath large subunit [Roseospira visakhapatnamensis]MBB4267231.1 type VI secretion system protein ImpD [Roseospira visakhapatnamensis]